MPSPISITLFRLSIAFTQKAFGDIPEEQMRAQPAPGINPPVWLLGHMCVGWDSALRLIGQRGICPADYRRNFGPGSSLDAMPAELPPKKEMLETLSRIGDLLLAELPKVPDELWSKSNPSKFLTAELPTILDLSTHLLIGHHMMHIGQLTVWRRLMGLPSIMQL